MSATCPTCRLIFEACTCTGGVAVIENTVTFTRIGRHGGRSGSTAPEPIVRALSGEQLADSIAMYARRFLASPSFEVVYDAETGRGFILAGFRTAGEFTVTATSEARHG